MTLKTYMEDTSNGLCPLSLNDLKIIKDSLTDDDIKVLIEQSEEIFIYPPQTITIYPKVITKDKHEYESISLYSWPNPDTEDGLPYILRDGYINHDNLQKDKLSLRCMSYVVYLAGLMFYITNDQRYYQVIEQQITSFFINPETRMNPSLAHGQAHPGLNNGQSGGIIDMGVSFGYSLSILGAIKEANLIDQKLDEGLSSWVSEMISWLLTHPHAIEMKNKTNNHSMVYDYFLLMLAKYNNRNEIIEEIGARFSNRVALQIEDDGSMPQELARPKSRSYTMMNTRLWLGVGKYFTGAYSLPKIKRMMEFYLPFGQGIIPWERLQTQYYYKFYDLMYMYHADVYFGFSNKTFMTMHEINEEMFFYTLFKRVLNIQNKDL